MRQQRTIYFNDARHYYLFAFEPPMALEDAWAPVDEVAGTGVDTFAYGVERSDGLFYPSRVGMMFGADIQPFELAAYWRTWHNMQSLIERGLDPLTVLIDRAHDHSMDFWASLRMLAYGNMDPAHRLGNGGGGLAHAEVRAHILQVVEELATEYETDGVELDFALPPRILREEDVEATTPILTDYVEQLAERVRGQRSGVVGARVLPTEEMNLAQGLDVRAWLERGLVDFLVPIRYGYMILDGDMPIDWLVEAAHAADAAVYGTLQPYVSDESVDESVGAERVCPSPAQLRAAAMNLLDRGCDGLYAWFMPWPLGDQERSALSELGSRELMQEKDKHYVLARRSADEENQYPVALPVEIAADDRTQHTIPFYLADDAQEGRVSQVLLRIRIVDLVSDDRLEIALNGQSLQGEICRREFGYKIVPYQGIWLIFDLQRVRPQQGANRLEIALVGRPDDLVSPLRVADVEVEVKYHPLPTGSKRRI